MRERLAVDHTNENSPALFPLQPNKLPRHRIAPTAPPHSTAEVVDLAHHLRAQSSVDPALGDESAVLSFPSERAIRALNIVLASVALFILSPFLVLIAMAIKLTSRGPILYTQIRIGVDTRLATDRRLRRERRNGRDRRAGMDRRARLERRSMMNRRLRTAMALPGRRHEDIGGHPFRIYKFRSM